MNKSAVYISFLSVLMLSILFYYGYNQIEKLSSNGDFSFQLLKRYSGQFSKLFVLSIIVLVVSEISIVLGRKIFNRNLATLIYVAGLGFILLLEYFFLQAAGVSDSLFFNYEIYFLGRLILIIPVFILYQWLFRWSGKEWELADREALKFIVIVLGLFVTTLFVPGLGDSLSFSQRINGSFVLNLLGALPIALGNLIFNLGKHFYGMRGSSKQLQLAQKEVLSSQSALNTLQSSVNPHFLYNALNSIAALAEEDPTRTKKMTLALADFYKHNTNREEKPFTTIAEEIEMVKTYLEIEKIRFEERLQYSIDVEDGLGGEKMPHFLLQPLVENAVKYGYDKQSDKIIVAIKITKKEGVLTIAIYDKGKHFEETMEKGYGLKSVSKKLKLLYPNQHEMSFINAPEKHVLIELKDKL